AAGLERSFQGAVLPKKICRRLRPDALRAGQLVRWVTAKRDEVGDLLRLDAVALPNLSRADPRDLRDTPRREQDHRAVACELVGIAVSGGDDAGPAAFLFCSHCGGEEG